MQHSAFQRGAKVGSFIDCGVFFCFWAGRFWCSPWLEPEERADQARGRSAADSLYPSSLFFIKGTEKQIATLELGPIINLRTQLECASAELQHHFQILSLLILLDPFSFTTQVAGRVCQLFPGGFRCAPYCPISLARCTNCLAVKVLPTYCAVHLPLVVEVFQQVQKL